MTKRWVYLGQGEGAGTPVIERFIEVDEQDYKVGESFAFKKFKKALIPGGVYNVDQEEEHSVKEASVVFSRMLSDDEWLTEIQTNHQLFLAHKKRKAMETKFRKEFKLSNNLEELAPHYRKLYGLERQLFEMMVVARLRELAGKA